MTLIKASLTVLLLLVAACSNADKAKTISQGELTARITDQSAPIILDVRSEKEYQIGHVPGAIHVPYENYQQVIGELKLAKSDELVVYCESGFRAGKVELALEKQGYFEVRHLQGDMRAWRNAKLNIETTAQE